MSRSSAPAVGALNAAALETPAGHFIAHFSERGLARLEFPRPHVTLPVPDLNEWSADWLRWRYLTLRAVLDTLNGRPPAEFPPIDLSCGTEFQQRVWAALRGIPTGATKSYGEIAQEVGSPKAVRAVGGACGANPVPLLVPCHRVLAAGARLGGFSGGLDWKLRLLAAEGAELRDGKELF
jgi:methylated-DNA-[protein]-cysteine S-methyltransferase